jgi:tetratricopeptide (TPR) repeat protein
LFIKKSSTRPPQNHVQATHRSRHISGTTRSIVNSWLVWFILSAVTGRPILSALVLLAFWFFTDRFTLGLLPDPLRLVSRFRRRKQLEATLQHNVHDHRARLELAQLEVERNNGKRAVELLRPSFDAGADDVQSVFTMGTACLQAGFVDQGEKLLDHAEELDADFRVGEIELVRGRYRLRRKDFAKATGALEKFIRLRGGTVEGRVLLAQAHDAQGDDVKASLLKDEAWQEFVAAPRFRRRQERWWAWRARPSRPLLYLALSLLVLGAVVSVVKPLVTSQLGSQSDFEEP